MYTPLLQTKTCMSCLWSLIPFLLQWIPSQGLTLFCTLFFFMLFLFRSLPSVLPATSPRATSTTGPPDWQPAGWNISGHTSGWRRRHVCWFAENSLHTLEDVVSVCGSHCKLILSISILYSSPRAAGKPQTSRWFIHNLDFHNYRWPSVFKVGMVNNSKILPD